ncbi:tyrosine-specific transport system isoform X2 [Ricinus communis]|nr:tyrosine-specific transport system isoform X2 [Ricinus communis]
MPCCKKILWTDQSHSTNGPLPRYMGNLHLCSIHSIALSSLSVMDIQRMPSSSSLYYKASKSANPPWPTSGHRLERTKLCFKYYKICGNRMCACIWLQQKTWPGIQRPIVTKAKKGSIELTDEEEKNPAVKVVADKKGTIAGAVALIIGTSIGSGILALPQKASPAGIIPSSVTIIVCWGFLLLEALLLIEINVGLRRKKKKRGGEGELDVISLRTMAQETLGDWGGTLATMTYVFLGYTSMIAYSSKSGELLFHLINLPEPLSGCLFTALFTMLISIGGTSATDQVNQWLTVTMIGLLIAIEVLAVVLGGWSGLEGSCDWGKVPTTVPVIIFSLVYHDLAPVLCAYLGGDLPRLRASVLLGSLVPLLGLLVWDTIALGLSAQTDQVVDPVELLMSVRWSGVSYMVEAFSLLAVGTSLIGTLLGFSEFFKEQLKDLSWHSSATQILQERNMIFVLNNWWERNKISFTAMAMVVAPTLLVSTNVPDAFSAATDIAGGYCMTMLYGVLPPAMAWAMYDREKEDTKEKVLWKAKPALVGVGIFACGIMVEQIFQYFSELHL